MTISSSGSKTFVVGGNLAYTGLQTVLVSNGSDYMNGTVTSYTSTGATGSMTISVNSAVGVGNTYNSWTVNLAGASGGNGAAGSAGTSGFTGSSGSAGTSGSTGTSGSNGSSGSSGSAGSSGTRGSSGSSGTSGSAGSSGTRGSSGSSGTSGSAGSSGTRGSSGSSGTTGSSGSSGSSGTRGSSGSSGTRGSSGSSGTSGSSGSAGSAGRSGSAGSSGTSGSAGSSGTSGSSGSSGTSGSSGSSGTTGSSGSSGTSGSAGSSGTTGSSGSAGSTGSSGISGAAGSNGTSGTGFDTISSPGNYRILTASGSSTNQAIANSGFTYNFLNSSNSSTALQVQGNIGVTNSGGNAKLTLESQFGVRSYLAAESGGAAIGSVTNHPVIFYQNNIQRAILSNGLFGINTNSPTALLHVATSSPGQGFRLVDGSQGTNRALVSDANGGASWLTYSNILAAASGVTGSGITNYVPYWLSTQRLSSTSSIYVNGNNVGIGLTQATSPLHVRSLSLNSTVFDIDGVSGDLFNVTDSLTGSLFSVNDISGLPVIEAFSDSTVVLGNYQAPVLYTTVKAVTAAATTNAVIYSLSATTYTSAFFDYNVTSGTNSRAGSIQAVWNSTGVVEFNEVTTIDIGTTLGTGAINFTVAASGANIQLRATTAAGAQTWTTKVIVRAI